LKENEKETQSQIVNKLRDELKEMVSQ